ncbi:MAG: PAS domain S-box-containing protein [Sulfurimonas sp.]|jgi:PAS domain S-box-containing protein|uniref:PAS domain-containing protein n=1 Tax=Sulfurimonas sp. TaxID=2022749 RepID=UPI0039E39F65
MPSSPPTNNQDLLQNAKSRRNSWIESSPVCTKIIDLGFNLQYMSRAGYEALQIADISTYYGKQYPLDFYPQSFHDEMTKTIKSARDTGKSMTQEASLQDLNGNDLWFHSTITPMYDQKNQLEYFMIVSIDITERMSTEIKLNQMNTKLESVVASRMKELKKANKQ